MILRIQNRMERRITRPRQPAVVVVIVALVLLAFASSATAQEPADLLTKHGIRAVSEPSPASDFTLPDLDGNRVSLSDYHGRWVLLTFFATWCGPCRSEMPGLEQLHRQWGGAVAVVGVSVDQDQAPVGPFVERLGISFDVLWDERGEVGRAYRASSIPLSYLIDPSGRIAGVAQGARDWSAMAGLFDELVAMVPPDDAAPMDYAAQGPVELASVTEPPTAEVALAEPEPVAGKVFHLDVRLLWAGSFEECVPHTPHVQLPEGVERLGVSASSSSKDGRNVVSYRIALRAAEPGSYALDPLELGYTPRDGSSPMSTRLLGPTVTVRPFTVLGLRPLVLLVVVAASVVVIAAMVPAIIFLRRRRRSRPAVGTSSEYDELRARFDAARAQRVQGNAAAFVEGMSSILTRFGDLEEERAAELRDLVERVRYGGQSPPAEELDRLQRAVQRRLDGLRPDPEENEREAVRLAEEGE